MKCWQCAHWIESERDAQVGECVKLPSDKMDVVIKCGLDGGYVSEITTDANFFCAYFTEREGVDVPEN